MLTKKTTRFIACPITSLAMLAFLFFYQANQQTQADAAQSYHDDIARAMDELPMSFGDWVAHTGIVPPAASEMLHANEIVSRKYRNIVTGEAVDLILVHCSDSRDLIGHYPPVCYPAHGWHAAGSNHQALDYANAAGGDTSCSVYQFSRLNQGDEVEMTIVNFMIMPDGSLARDMTAVEASAADLSNRQYGAMQVQVIFWGVTDERDQREILNEMVEHIKPAILAVWDIQGAAF